MSHSPIVAIVILLIVSGFLLWLFVFNRSASSTVTKSHEAPVWTKEEREVIVFVHQWLSDLSDREGRFDSRPNLGGYHYSAGTIKYYTGSASIAVPLQITPTLPRSHPNYEEIATPFIVVIEPANSEDVGYIIKKAPSKEELKAFFDEWLQEHQSTTQYTEEEKEVILFVHQWLSDLSDREGRFDSRPNRGGYHFGVGDFTVEPMTQMPLVLRPTLPRTHPNYEEVPTPFSVTVDMRGGEYSLEEVPTQQELADFFDQWLAEKALNTRIEFPQEFVYAEMLLGIAVPDQFVQRTMLHADGQDIPKIQKHIEAMIDNHNSLLARKITPLRSIDEYAFQLVPFVNETGGVSVWVNAMRVENAEYDIFKKDIIETEDGGNSYFHVIIDMETGAYRDLEINGEA